MTGRNLTASALLLFSSWLMAAPIGAAAAVHSVPAHYSSIADALAASQAGDRVEIAPGTYTETLLALPNGVALVGTGNSPDQVIIDGQGFGRILLVENVDDSALVTNITFTNGRAVGRISYERSGGAIFCRNSSLRISNCIFRDNRSDGNGGAIRCNNSTPEITGCVFIGNKANDGGGGAIDCSFSSSPLIRGCDFRENTASWGGALSCRGNSSPVVQSSTFTDNEASGPKGYGGAVFADLKSKPVFTQATISDNFARYGGGLACLSSAETNLQNCTISANGAQILGGGLFIYNAAPRINSSIIVFQSGTGITAEGTSAPVINCTDIFGNSLGDWVGSISMQLAGDDNLATDPMFCTEATNGTNPYVLADDSPCAATGLACGVMGAWPPGCDAVNILASSLAANWNSQQAQLSWQIRVPNGTSPVFRLTGAAENDPDTEWDVDVLSLGGGYFEATDPNINQGGSGSFIYRLYTSDPNGSWTLLDTTNLTIVPSVPGISNLKAWPNPFNPMTTISFKLGQPQRTRISVYTPAGRRVAVLTDRELAAGPQSQVWDGRDASGGVVSSGTYIVLVEGTKEKKTQKITLLK